MPSHTIKHVYRGYSAASPPPPAWSALRASAKPEVTTLINLAAELSLEPSDVADLTLADLAVLLPDAQPVLLLQLRQLARRDGDEQAATVQTKEILPPSWVHHTGYFWGKILEKDPTDVGNARLAVWFEASLIMATLLFSISLSLSLEPAASCENPADEGNCATLIVVDQVVWMSASLLLLVGAGILWADHMVITHLTSEEVAHFVCNNVRLTVWGIAIAMLGVFAFFPGIVVRVWIVSASRTPQIVVLTLSSLGFCSWLVYNVLMVASLLGVHLSAVPVIWLAAFGLLPGSNRLRLAGEEEQQQGGAKKPARVEPA